MYRIMVWKVRPNCDANDLVFSRLASSYEVAQKVLKQALEYFKEGYVGDIYLVEDSSDEEIIYE